MAAGVQGQRVVLLHFDSSSAAKAVLDRHQEITELYLKAKLGEFGKYLSGKTDVDKGVVELAFPAIAAKRALSILVRFLQKNEIVVQSGTIATLPYVKRRYSI